MCVRYSVCLVQHVVVCEGSKWGTPGLQVPSNFLLKEETPEEKVMKAESHVTGSENVAVF